MLTERITNRWQAFAIHLSISIAVFAVLAALIYRWYPGILFKYDGGLEGIKLIAGVDLVMGPLLTLLVFNRAKKSLKMDLSIIGALQVLCLIGGMWTVYQTRPVTVVYNDGVFRSLSYQTLKNADVDVKSQSIFQQRWPVWVAIDAADDKRAFSINAKNNLTNTDKYRLIDETKAQEIYKLARSREQLKSLPAFDGQKFNDGDKFVVVGMSGASGFFIWREHDMRPVGFVADTHAPSLIKRIGINLNRLLSKFQ